MMRHLRPSDYRIMPWKNGGGSTTEIAIFPETSGLLGEAFKWRVSIADVVLDGPFSTFAGYDRHIMVIAGAGMVLDIAECGELDLSRPFVPMSFSGDWSVEGRLKRGPVRDFNLIVARSFARSRLGVEMFASRKVFQADGDIRLFNLLEEEIIADGHIIAAGETIILDRGEALEVKPLGPPARLAVCRISPL